MRYIQELREGSSVKGTYMCRRKTSLVTRNGKNYESLTLQDKTGSIDAKIWDPGSMGIEDFDELDFIEVTGDVISFQGHLQMNIKRARRCREGEYDPVDFLPVSDKNIDSMMGAVLKYVDSVKEPHLNALLRAFFVEDEDFISDFRFSSAAKSVHHSFVGGLLEHTLGVTNLCHFFCRNYPYLNRDLLVTTALLHDIGKTRELSRFPQNDYTEAGQLIGHIIIGVQMIDEKIRDIPDFPVLLADEVRHCILAHHGELEFGSPKKPALAEAAALNFADNTDAKLEIFREALATGSGDGWVGYQNFLGSNVRSTEV
ncbi:MAG: HD domain-containing protein [Lachnospiraceae bacterium]|nr:HD domain-containing protein [Lachnospiraceae bacterium]